MTWHLLELLSNYKNLFKQAATAGGEVVGEGEGEEAVLGAVDDVLNAASEVSRNCSVARMQPPPHVPWNLQWEFRLYDTYEATYTLRMGLQATICYHQQHAGIALAAESHRKA